MSVATFSARAVERGVLVQAAFERGEVNSDQQFSLFICRFADLESSSLPPAVSTRQSASLRSRYTWCVPRRTNCPQQFSLQSTLTFQLVIETADSLCFCGLQGQNILVFSGFALESTSNDRSLSVPQLQSERGENYDATRPHTSPNTSTQPAEFPAKMSPTQSERSPSRSRGSSRERGSSPSNTQATGRASPNNQLQVPQHDASGSSSDSDSGPRSNESRSRSNSRGQGHKFRNRVLPLYGDVNTLPTPHQFPDQPLVIPPSSALVQNESTNVTNSMGAENMDTSSADDFKPSQSADWRTQTHMEREISVVSDVSSVGDDTRPLVATGNLSTPHDMKRGFGGSGWTHGFENPVFSYSISNDSAGNESGDDWSTEPLPVKRQRSDDDYHHTSVTCWGELGECQSSPLVV